MSFPRRQLVDTEWNYSNSTNADIQAASLQDIARSMRVIAQSYQGLIDDRDRYKRWYQDEVACRERRDRQIASLRGVITRLKRKGGAA